MNMLLLDVYIGTTRLTSVPKLEHMVTLRVRSVVVDSAIRLVDNHMHLSAIKGRGHVKIFFC